MRCEALCAILRPDPGTSRLHVPDRPVLSSQARFCRSGRYLGSCRLPLHDPADDDSRLLSVGSGSRDRLVQQRE